MRKDEKTLRLLIRETLILQSRIMNETQQVANPLEMFKTKVASMNLKPELAESAIAVKTLEAKIKSSLGIDGPTLGMLLPAAFAISGRESSYGQGRRYQWTSWAETLASQYGVSDASIGATQVKYGENFGPGSALAGYGAQVGISGAASLSEYPKAIMATIGMLTKLYQKATSIGYTAEPGVASKPYKSTGNAALDIALIGYNMGPNKITNYCGAGTLKKACAPGAADVVKNYIPSLADGSLTSLGYVGEVSTEMAKFAALKPLF